MECKNAIFIMTSNLASDEIGEHAIQLRDDARRIFEQRLSKKGDEEEENEPIEISRKFKDQVVNILFFSKSVLNFLLNDFLLLGTTNIKVSLQEGRVSRQNKRNSLFSSIFAG